MELALRFVEAIAWPMVALVGIIILGPGGILMKVADKLSASVSDFTRALPELRTTALTLRADVDTLVEKSREMSKGVSDEFSAIERRLDAISGRVSGSLDHIRNVVDDIDRGKIEEEQRLINDAVGNAPQMSEEMPVPIASNLETLNSEQMLEQIRIVWSNLVSQLRERVGNSMEFDARQIGSIAWRMADGRRVNPIPRETADLIQTLHSQFKRFTRMSSSSDEWMTVDLLASFEAGVQKVVRQLKG